MKKVESEMHILVCQGFEPTTSTAANGGGAGASKSKSTDSILEDLDKETEETIIAQKVWRSMW